MFTKYAPIPKGPARMNGMRQPHSFTAASGMMVYMTVAKALPTNSPMAVEAGTIEQYIPRLSVGAYSAKNVAEMCIRDRPCPA